MVRKIFADKFNRGGVQPFLRLTALLCTVFALALAGCAGSAGGDSGAEPETGYLRFATGGARAMADYGLAVDSLRNLKLVGKRSGGELQTLAGPWATAADTDGVSVPVEAGAWVFGMVAECDGRVGMFGDMKPASVTAGESTTVTFSMNELWKEIPSTGLAEGDIAVTDGTNRYAVSSTLYTTWEPVLALYNITEETFTHDITEAEVGDIVLASGKCVSPANYRYVTGDPGVAVVFYTGTSSWTEYPDNTACLGNRVLAIHKTIKGPQEGGNLYWKSGVTLSSITSITCNEVAAIASGTRFTFPCCTPWEYGDSAPIKRIQGDFNGKDNWNAIEAALGANATVAHFPAYNWLFTNVNGGSTGPYYMPSLAEMAELLKVVATVNSSLRKLDGGVYIKITNGLWYCSSTINSSGNIGTLSFGTNDGNQLYFTDGNTFGIFGIRSWDK